MHSNLISSANSFFKDCEIVVRAPGVFFWTGEHSVAYGHPSLLQPINLYLYAGLKRTKTRQCSMNLIHADPSAPINTPDKLEYDKHFITGAQEPSLRTLVNLIQKELNQWVTKLKLNSGIELRVLSEVPFSSGLNAEASLSLCLSMIYNYLKNGSNRKAFTKTIKELKAMEPQSLLSDKRFRSIFVKARWCDDLPASHYKSGAAPFAAFLGAKDHKGLIVFLTEKKGFGSQKPIFPKSKNAEEHMKYIEDMEFWGTRIPTPPLIRDNTYAVSLIYCGAIEDPLAVDRDMFQWHKLENNNLRKLKKSANSIIPKKLLAEPLIRIMSASKTVEETSYPRYIYNCALGTLSWRLIDLLLSKKNEAENFKELIIENHKLLKAYGVLRGSLRSFSGRLKRNMDSSLMKQLGITMTGAGNGGCLVVIGEKHDVGNVIKLIPNLKRADSQEIPQVHYSSLEPDTSIPQPDDPVCDFGMGTDPPPPNGRVTLILNKDGTVTVRLEENGTTREFQPHGGKSVIQCNILREFAYKFRKSHDGESPLVSAWEVYCSCRDEIDDKSKKELRHTNPSKKELNDALKWAEDNVKLLANNLGRNGIKQSKVFEKRDQSGAGDGVHQAYITAWRLVPGVKIREEDRKVQ